MRKILIAVLHSARGRARLVVRHGNGVGKSRHPRAGEAPDNGARTHKHRDVVHRCRAEGRNRERAEGRNRNRAEDGTETEGAADAAAQHAACLTAGIDDTVTPDVQYDDQTGACSLDTGGDNESGDN